MEDDSEERALKGGGTGRVLIIGAVLALLIVGGGATAYYFSEPEMDPTVVVVARMGSVHEHFDDPFVRAFAAQLAEHGFEVVTHDAPIEADDEQAAIQALRPIAWEARAGSAVLLVVGAENEREGILAGQHLFRAHLASHVIPIASDQAVATRSSEFAFEGTSALDVASSVQSTWLDTIGPDTIDALYDVVAIREVAEGRRDLEMARMRLALDLRDKLPRVEARRERIEAFAQHCALAREEVNNIASSEDGVSCLGDPCRPWSALGLSPDGQTAYVHEHYREPIFEMIDSGRMRWTEPPEAVQAVPLDGGEPRALLRVGHFYGLAYARPDGGSLGASFFGNGVPAVVTLDPQTGDWQQRWLLSGRERVPWKQPSEDGSMALVYRREQGWALLSGGEPVIMPSFREASLVRFPDGEVRVVGSLETGELTVIGLDAAPEDVRLPLEGTVRAILEGTADEQLDLLLAQGRHCSLQRFNLTERTLGEPIPLPVCLRDSNTLPDGRLIGAAVWSGPDDAPGDLEIVIVDPDSGEVTGITRNTLRDELPSVSQDGSRLIFSRRVGEWPPGYDLQLYRRVICVADVPAR